MVSFGVFATEHKNNRPHTPTPTPQRYDDGVTDIVNTDFCASVIRAQLAAHARERPRMRWRVADITALDSTTFPDASFDLVLDKGGLDALHSDADDDGGCGDAAAKAMLACALRVTAHGGSYVCVTLAQPHVLACALAAFRTRDWTITLDAPPPPPDMAAAPLQPVVVVATRRERGSDTATPLPPVVSLVKHALAAPNADQLDGVAGVVAAENEARARGERVPPACAPPASPTDDNDPFASLAPGHTTRLTLPRGAATPCYDVSIVDAPSPPPGPPTAAVFVVPLGRDHEWLFASEEGVATMAAQVGAGRVIIVRLCRSADHGSLAAVRAALSPHMAPLTPSTLRGVVGAVPIVTVGEGIGCRTRVATLASQTAGCDILIEDVSPPPDAPKGVVGLRRLVFGGAVGLVQSEAVLVKEEAPGPRRSGRGGGRAGGCTAPPPPPKPVVALADHLPVAYHSAVLAHLALAGVCVQRGGGSADNDTKPSVAVIGLGGGGLPAALSTHTGLAVTTVELDPIVVDVARSHFGFGGDVTTGDGTTFIAASQPASLAAIIVDAGGGDGGGAMTCPPPAFAEREFVSAARAALTESGVLIINVVARSPAPVAALIDTLKAEFECVLEIDVPDDVNRVLAATQVKIDPAPGAAVAARLPRALRKAGGVVGGASVAELAELVVVR